MVSKPNCMSNNMSSLWEAITFWNWGIKYFLFIAILYQRGNLRGYICVYWLTPAPEGTGHRTVGMWNYHRECCPQGSNTSHFIPIWDQAVEHHHKWQDWTVTAEPVSQVGLKLSFSTAGMECSAVILSIDHAVSDIWLRLSCSPGSFSTEIVPISASFTDITKVSPKGAASASLTDGIKVELLLWELQRSSHP